MDAILTCTSHVADETSHVKLLDPHADAILEVDQGDEIFEFHISTKVLGLASPVFAKMFGPDFEEGRRVRGEQCPRIRLVDDDPRAMGTILAALHYRGINQLQLIDAESLATLAIHCDKYDCMNALSPWISYWFNCLTSTAHSSEDLGCLLLAAYLFGESRQFKSISAEAVRDMTAGFSFIWESHEIASLLSDTVYKSVAAQRKWILDKLHNELQLVESSLRQNKNGYEMQRLVCIVCGRTQPMEAKKCHPCNNTTLYPKHCTSESRISEYFAILTQEELWPTVTPFNDCSVSDLIVRFTCTRKDLKHSCAAASGCPLERDLARLCEKVMRVKESAKGFCLNCTKKGQEWNSREACECA